MHFRHFCYARENIFTAFWKLKKSVHKKHLPSTAVFCLIKAANVNETFARLMYNTKSLIVHTVLLLNAKRLMQPSILALLTANGMSTHKGWTLSGPVIFRCFRTNIISFLHRKPRDKHLYNFARPLKTGQTNLFSSLNFFLVPQEWQRPCNSLSFSSVFDYIKLFAVSFAVFNFVTDGRGAIWYTFIKMQLSCHMIFSKGLVLHTRTKDAVISQFTN